MLHYVADSVLLKPSRRKHLLLLAVACAFVAGGVISLHAGHPLAGWLGIVFFGFCALVFAAYLVPGGNHLRLGAEGFTVRSLFRDWHVAWPDTSEFFVARISGNKSVCWNYSSTYSKYTRSRIIARGLTGAEASLPDTYGLSADDLAQLLNQWRARHGNANASSPPLGSA
ncbi:MAG: hypothetical protein J7549_09130 [Variovorax sp.]|nr:hypothetical protein [Variovorax sp.]